MWQPHCRTCHTLPRHTFEGVAAEKEGREEKDHPAIFISGCSLPRGKFQPTHPAARCRAFADLFDCSPVCFAASLAQ